MSINHSLSIALHADHDAMDEKEKSKDLSQKFILDISMKST